MISREMYLAFLMQKKEVDHRKLKFSDGLGGGTEQIPGRNDPGMEKGCSKCTLLKYPLVIIFFLPSVNILRQ